MAWNLAKPDLFGLIKPGVFHLKTLGFIVILIVLRRKMIRAEKNIFMKRKESLNENV